MKTVKNQSRQGELCFTKIAKLPEGLTEVQRVNGRFIVGHSETGHHHYIDSINAKFYESPNPNICYLKIDGEAYLEHAREFETHETQAFLPGIYQVDKQVENTPDGWRQVQD